MGRERDPRIPDNLAGVVRLTRKLRRELRLTVVVGRSSIWVTQGHYAPSPDVDKVVVEPERWESAVLALLRGLNVDVRKV